MSALGQNVGGYRSIWLVAIVIFEFALEGADGNPEFAGGMGAVAAALLEGFDDGEAFKLFDAEADGNGPFSRGMAGPVGDVSGEIEFGQDVAIGEDHHAFQGVAKLTDVAGPSVGEEAAHDFGRNAARGGVLMLDNFL